MTPAAVAPNKCFTLLHANRTHHGFFPFQQGVFALAITNFRGCTVDYIRTFLALLDSFLANLNLSPFHVNDVQKQLLKHKGSPILFPPNIKVLIPSAPHHWGGAVMSFFPAVHVQTSKAIPVCLAEQFRGESQYGPLNKHVFMIYGKATRYEILG